MKPEKTSVISLVDSSFSTEIDSSLAPTAASLEAAMLTPSNNARAEAFAARIRSGQGEVRGRVSALMVLKTTGFFGFKGLRVICESLKLKYVI